MARHGRATMPFGKYKGVRVRVLPDAYLSWLSTTKIMRAAEWAWLWQSVSAEMTSRGLRADLAQTDEPEVTIPDKPKRAITFDD